MTKLDPATMGNTNALAAFLRSPTSRNARKLTDAQLGNAKEPRGPFPNSGVIAAADAELARRIAWRGPARLALVISAASFLVSFISLAIAALRH